MAIKLGDLTIDKDTPIGTPTTLTPEEPTSLIGGRGSSRLGSLTGSLVTGAARAVSAIPKTAEEFGVGVYNAFVPDEEKKTATDVFTPLDTMAAAVEGIAGAIATPNPEYADRFPEQLAGGLGSIATAALPMGLLGKVGGAIGTTIVGGSGVSQEAREDYSFKMKEAGLKEDPDDASAVAFYNFLGGTTEAIPIARLFGRLDKMTAGNFRKNVNKVVTQGVIGTGEEALQEGFQQTLQNLIASDIVGYDPDRDIFHDSANAAAVGGGVGAIVNSIAATLGIRKLGRMEQAATQARAKSNEPLIEEARKLTQGEAPVDPETGTEYQSGDIKSAATRIEQLKKMRESLASKTGAGIEGPEPAGANQIIEAYTRRMEGLASKIGEKYLTDPKADPVKAAEAESLLAQYAPEKISEFKKIAAEEKVREAERKQRKEKKAKGKTTAPEGGAAPVAPTTTPARPKKAKVPKGETPVQKQERLIQESIDEGTHPTTIAAMQERLQTLRQEEAAKAPEVAETPEPTEAPTTIGDVATTAVNTPEGSTIETVVKQAVNEKAEEGPDMTPVPLTTKEVEQVSEELNKVEYEGPERRSNKALRDRISQMTPEQLEEAIYTSPKASIPNARAYQDAEKLPIQVSLDLDSLKWVNDEMGHEVGDKMLKEVGRVLKDLTGDAFHVSGDEFILQGRTEEEVQEIVSELQERLASVELSATRADGEVITKKGIQFSYGTGSDLTKADQSLQAHKAARETSGERAGRGAVPPGVSRQPRAGEQATEEPAGPVTATPESATLQVAPVAPIPPAAPTTTPQATGQQEGDILTKAGKPFAGKGPAAAAAKKAGAGYEVVQIGPKAYVVRRSGDVSTGPVATPVQQVTTTAPKARKESPAEAAIQVDQEIIDDVTRLAEWLATVRSPRKRQELLNEIEDKYESLSQFMQIFTGIRSGQIVATGSEVAVVPDENDTSETITSIPEEEVGVEIVATTIDEKQDQAEEPTPNAQAQIDELNARLEEIEIEREELEYLPEDELSPKERNRLTYLKAETRKLEKEIGKLRKPAKQQEVERALMEEAREAEEMVDIDEELEVDDDLTGFSFTNDDYASEAVKRGPGTPSFIQPNVNVIKKALQSFIKLIKLPDVKVIIPDSYDDIPEKLRNIIFDIHKSARSLDKAPWNGYFWKDIVNGKPQYYVIVNPYKPATPQVAIGTLFHELVGHYGMMKLLGDTKYREFLERMVRTNPAITKTLMQEYRIRWYEGERYNLTPKPGERTYVWKSPVTGKKEVVSLYKLANLADEYVAEMAKKLVDEDFRKEVTGGNKTLLTRVVTWLKHFWNELLKKTGIDYKVTDQDIINFLADSYDNIFVGKNKHKAVSQNYARWIGKRDPLIRMGQVQTVVDALKNAEKEAIKSGEYTYLSSQASQMSLAELQFVTAFSEGAESPLGNSTLKVFRAIPSNVNPVDKFSYVMQKLREVNATKSEVRVVEDTLLTLYNLYGADWTWDEFIALASKSLIHTTLKKTKKYASYGASWLNLFDPTSFRNKDYATWILQSTNEKHSYSKENHFEDPYYLGHFRIAHSPGSNRTVVIESQTDHQQNLSPGKPRDPKSSERAKGFIEWATKNLAILKNSRELFLISYNSWVQGSSTDEEFLDTIIGDPEIKLAANRLFKVWYYSNNGIHFQENGTLSVRDKLKTLMEDDPENLIRISSDIQSEWQNVYKDRKKYQNLFKVSNETVTLAKRLELVHNHIKKRLVRSAISQALHRYINRNEDQEYRYLDFPTARTVGLFEKQTAPVKMYSELKGVPVELDVQAIYADEDDDLRPAILTGRVGLFMGQNNTKYPVVEVYIEENGEYTVSWYIVNKSDETVGELIPEVNDIIPSKKSLYNKIYEITREAISIDNIRDHEVVPITGFFTGTGDVTRQTIAYKNLYDKEIIKQIRTEYGSDVVSDYTDENGYTFYRIDMEKVAQKASKTFDLAFEMDSNNREVISDDVAASMDEMQQDPNFKVPEIDRLRTQNFGATRKNAYQRFWDRVFRRIKASRIGSKLSPMGNMAHEASYDSIHAQTLGRISTGDRLVRRLNAAYRNLTSTQNKAIYEYFTTRNADINDLPISAEAKKVTKEAKEMIEKLGENFVDLGILSRDVYEESKGAYLPIRYWQYIKSYPGSGKRPSFLNYLKSRNVNLTQADKTSLGRIEDVRFLLTETVATMNRDSALINMFNTLTNVSTENRYFWVLQDEAYVNFKGQTMSLATIEDSITHYTELLEDGIGGTTFNWSPDQVEYLRSRLNDLREAHQQGRGALNKSLTEAMLARGMTAAEIDQASIESFMSSEFAQMPKDKIYGDLRGRWVRKEIYQDLIDTYDKNQVDENSEFSKWFSPGGKIDKINQFWKWLKVPANLPSWVRNAVSNFVLLDISTATPSYQLAGMLSGEIEGAATGNPSRYWKWAEQFGLFGTTYSTQELYLLQQTYQEKLARKLKRGELSKPEGIMKDLQWLAEEKLYSLMELTTQGFGLLEGTFKTVRLRDHVERWESENGIKLDTLPADQQKVVLFKAVEEANKSLFDYSKIPNFIRMLRRYPLGAPFITFTYKAFPAVIEGFARQPQKFIKYAALPYIMMQAFLMSNPEMDDEDLEELKSKMPRWMEERGSVYILPWKDANNQWQAMDFGYFFPWEPWQNFIMSQARNYRGDAMTVTSNFMSGVKDMGFLGGPLPTTISAFLTNRDDFSGQEIITTGAAPGQQMSELMTFVGHMWLPTWMSSHGALGKIMDELGTPTIPGIASGKPLDPKTGTERGTMGQAVARLAGANVYAFDPQIAERKNIASYNIEINKIKSARNKVLRDANLSREEKTQKLREYNQMIKEVQRRRTER